MIYEGCFIAIKGEKYIADVRKIDGNDVYVSIKTKYGIINKKIKKKDVEQVTSFQRFTK